MRWRKVGPNPTDRGRCGSKLNVMTDRAGIPLAVIVSAANDHDIRFILPLVLLAFPVVGGAPGRPRIKPDLVRADQGYTSKDLLDLLASVGIEAEIPQQGTAHCEGLGKRRWPVERAISWLKQFRRIGTRRDRLSRVYESMVTLACILIAHRSLAAIAF
ncbi:transposase [Roseiconus nitratireducens]|uniref:Transposase n=1 Tax=Roseiconus nitratireducens TaxID=2605748 RepID=A0A5M6CLI8_9BACT|nr:transposase [Roseiconus nitratireducens]